MTVNSTRTRARPVRPAIAPSPPPLMPQVPVPAAAVAALGQLLEGSPDLVDRIFEYVVELVPEISPRRQQIKNALREEFGAQEGYVRRREYTAKQLEAEIERLLKEHGRNVDMVARVLGITPGTVYRKIRSQLDRAKNSQSPLDLRKPRQ